MYGLTSVTWFRPSGRIPVLPLFKAWPYCRNCSFVLPQVEHYAEVLPVVLGVMGDPDASVQERGCYALDTFCEAMEPEQIAPYMPKV